MADKPFIEVDTNRFKADVGKIQRALDILGADIADPEGGVGQATLEYAEHVMGEAARRAPIGDGSGNSIGVRSVAPGTLRASMHLDGPRQGPGGPEIIGGFSEPYSFIQDQGGEVRPVKARALFIPLRSGVRPGQPGLELFRDFMLIPGPGTNKTSVIIPGTRYLTGTVEELQSQAAEMIGRRALELSARRAGFRKQGRDAEGRFI